jgi:hypothetical protein
MRAQGLIIPAGGYLIANNGNLVLNSNWVNNGSFTHNGGTVIFAGGTQTLGGSSASNFNNLTTSATSTTTITSPGHSIKNILLSNGTLNANGNLTLLSTAAKTAAVDGSGSGEIYGNLVVQRYITSGFGYKYFSSPFQADTVGDFSNDMNLNAAFPTFYRHDENQASNGWITYTSGSGALNPMQGYAANLGASNTAKTVDLKGVVNNHNLSLNLFNHNMTYTQGFNLVGNPYPSPINWDAVGGWTKTNIDNAIYFFNAGTTNQYTGVYSSYINGVSSDGIAGSTIAAMQGFFVHVSNGSYPVAAVLGVNNSARIINSAANFFRIEGQPGNPSLLRLSVGFAEQTDLADPLVFYFDDAAAGKFDKKLDALKLMNTDSLVPSLYAVSADTKRLSIHALAATHDTLTVVPLGLITKKDGWVSFNAKDMQGLPAPLYVYLADTKTGLNQDLQKDPLYRLFLTAGEYDNRFFLKFSSKTLDGGTATTSSTEAFSVYSAGGRLFVNGHLAAGEKASLTVINMLGQVVGRYEIAGNTYTPLPENFSSGLYVVNIKGPSKNYSKKIFAGTQ